MGFSDLKKKSQNLEKLTEELNKITKGGESYKDERFWRPELDKSSNGYAVIRFLPPVDGEDVPWARLFNHGFQGKGGWLIENCPTTLGLPCPICEANSELWNSGIESDKEIARDRKRKLSYISNVLVISDPANPQNEGKVFLYKYGKKIFDKINEAMNPEFEDEEPLNPFDFWTGANFKLKIRKVAGYVNYDRSEFDSPEALFGGDDAVLEKLWKQQYPLREFVAPSNFKSYDELKKRFDVVLQGSGSTIPKTAAAADEDEADRIVSDRFGDPTSSGDSASPQVTVDDDAGDALSYFQRLANES